MNSSDNVDKQPDENIFISIHGNDYIKEFKEGCKMLVNTTGKGYVTIYFKDKQANNIVIHLDKQLQ